MLRDLIKERAHVLWRQGVACDGRHWYFSSRQYLMKYSLDLRLLVDNPSPIPLELKSIGYEHIGDVDYDGGTLYVPLEHYWRKEDHPRRRNGLILFFDSDLRFTGRMIEVQHGHLPWVAYREGVLWTSLFTNVDALFVYDAREADLIRKVRLSRTLQNVQGGAFLDEYLFLSTDDGRDTIYIVDSTTGKVLRSIPTHIGTEMEGIAVWDLPFGNIHFIDDGHYLYHFACPIERIAPSPSS